ncbi:MAG: response regulator [Thiocapsa sp.]|uniref:response regulator n=1 Tax=Thiocapsa sp. TaxID=2024551 RepID=UPI001BCC911D|nr:response regulator [Thiocapsa sp.]QVL50858.1 MAG: response regulator [Thiocapsa sp.]
MPQLNRRRPNRGSIGPLRAATQNRLDRFTLPGLGLIGVGTLAAVGALLWDLRAQASALGADPGLWAEFARTSLPQQTTLVIATVAVSAAASILWSLLTTRLTGREIAFLTESRERNRAIIDKMADGAVHIDAAGRLVAMNRAAETMFGYTSEEVRGKPMSILFAEPYRSEYRERIGDARTLGKTDALTEIRELEGMRKDATGFPLYIAMSRVDIGSSRVFTAVVRDLTATRRQMDALARARDEAMSADRAKSEFLAMMSHEIRTPMNGVLGMLELLRDSQLSRQQQDFINTAEKSGSLLLTVINDILDFSKIEAGKLDLQQIELDLRNVVEEVTGLVAAGVRERPIEVASFVHRDVPRVLTGDPYRIRQVLMNLMGNAVKFTACGEVVVRVTLDHPTQDGWLVRFEVTDTGIGIDPQILATLFRPFTQADASTTRRFGGTGLGLVISKRLAGLMGGEIGVESTPGVGSTFWFTLALTAATQTPDYEESDLCGIRTLIVDDNATNRLILKSHLARWGARTECAEDGLQALKALQRGLEQDRPFDLAILDMQMPGMDGIELAHRIKGDDALGATRLIMLSSLGYPGPEARRVGIEVTLLKPVREILLHDAAAKVLGMSRPDAGIVPVPPKRPTRRFDARVLVAEDNAVNQKVVTMMLHRFGIEPGIAADGQAAIEAVAHERFDLILMDIQMPKLSGHEATRDIRAAEQARGNGEHIPIVAMTAGVSERDREDCSAAGMDDFISKPAQIAELEAVLLRWLPGHVIGPIGHLPAAGSVRADALSM